MRTWLAACLLALVPSASAQDVIFYRCTNAAGVVTLQNGTPCPKGSRQEKRAVEAMPSNTLSPLPPPAAVVSTPVGATQPRTPPKAEIASSDPATRSPVLPLPLAEKPLPERLPPPPLYQCNTPDNDSYLSDTSDPKPRCMRIDTVGIDGSQQLGAGQACSMVYDQCQRVADNAACPAWRKRVNEAQAAWTFARADMSAEMKREYERISRVVAETTCNPAP